MAPALGFGGAAHPARSVVTAIAMNVNMVLIFASMKYHRRPVGGLPALPCGRGPCGRLDGVGWGDSRCLNERHRPGGDGSADKRVLVGREPALAQQRGCADRTIAAIAGRTVRCRAGQTAFHRSRVAARHAGHGISLNGQPQAQHQNRESKNPVPIHDRGGLADTACAFCRRHPLIQINRGAAGLPRRAVPRARGGSRCARRKGRAARGPRRPLRPARPCRCRTRRRRRPGPAGWR